MFCLAVSKQASKHARDPLPPEPFITYLNHASHALRTGTPHLQHSSLKSHLRDSPISQPFTSLSPSPTTDSPDHEDKKSKKTEKSPARGSIDTIYHTTHIVHTHTYTQLLISLSLSVSRSRVPFPPSLTRKRLHHSFPFFSIQKIIIMKTQGKLKHRHNVLTHKNNTKEVAVWYHRIVGLSLLSHPPQK